MYNRVECGDVGFVGTEKDFVSTAIKWFTTGRREGKTLASHQFQVIEGAQVLEAGSGRRHKTVIRPYIDRLHECLDDPQSHMIVFRPNFLSLEQKTIIQATAQKLNGSKYGYGEIALQASDGMLRKWGWLKEGAPFFAKLGDLLPGTMICSGVSNACLVEADVLLPKYRYLTPDDTFDFAIRDEWMLVAISKGSEDYWRQGFPYRLITEY